MWQDTVIAVGQWILAASLLPTVFGKEKPALTTSVISVIVMATFGFTFWTLAFWNAVASSVAGCSIWFLLAVQKYRSTRKQKRPS